MREEREFDQAPANDPSRTQAGARYMELRANKRKRSARLIVVAVLAVVLCVAVLGAGFYFHHINSLISTDDTELLANLKEQASDKPFYMLLMGVDKGEERYESEGTDSSNYRADTIMLTRIDPAATKATIVSIHRDLLVDLENGEQGKINAAYSLGGPAGMVREVNELAGIGINHYAEIDFDSFMSIVDAIGGVEVTLPIDVRDPDYTELDLSAGTQVLNGHDALMLCRARHAYDEYGDGDVFRAANQRMVISAIINKVLSSDPHTMVAAITTMADSITTDMSLNEILALAAQMQEFNTGEDLYTGMTPSEPEMIDDVYYEILDDEAWEHMMYRVNSGLPPYEAAFEDVTAGLAGSIVGTETSTDAPTTTSDATTAGDANALANIDKSGVVTVAGIMDGRATELANTLSELGFHAESYEDPSFAFDQNVIVYDDLAHADEAEALATYLGDDFVAILNDGSYYLISNIVVRLAA